VRESHLLSKRWKFFRKRQPEKPTLRHEVIEDFYLAVSAGNLEMPCRVSPRLRDWVGLFLRNASGEINLQ
jgi:hypothetical protein